MKSVGLEGVRNTAKNMFSFIKEKWLLFVPAFVLVVGFLLGFRITYAPELENSWSATSAVAAWVSAGATLAAVWAAVQIPKKIAERQNDITLFEKRYWLYMSFKSVHTLTIYVQSFCENLNDVRDFYSECFCVEPTLKTEIVKTDFSLNQQRYSFLKLKQNVDLLHLFFKNIGEDEEQCIYNVISALQVLSEVSSDLTFKKHKAELAKTVSSFSFEKVLKIMESQLKQV